MNTIDQVVAQLDGERFDLARPYTIGMPQSPNHPRYWHSLPRRHGDMVRADGGSAANDIIVTGTHVGTHIDALAHVSHDGFLHGGADAEAAQTGGRFTELGIHTVAPFIGRGVLLDIPAVRGVAGLDPGEEVTAADLSAAAGRLSNPIRPGDAVVIRTGWGARWDDGDGFVGRDTGVPGPGVDAAEWLAAQAPAFVGSDTIAFERIPPGTGHSVLPVHRLLLVDHGINIVETMALEALAVSGYVEFVLILVPLPLHGATGSPVRPIAVVPRT